MITLMPQFSLGHALKTCCTYIHQEGSMHLIKIYMPNRELDFTAGGIKLRSDDVPSLK